MCLSPAVHDLLLFSPLLFIQQEVHTRGTIRLGNWGEVSRTGCNSVVNGSGFGYTII